MRVRDFNKRRDLKSLRECLIELQDSERELDPRMPRGADIVDAYIPQMLGRCRACGGKVLVAEIAGSVAGYATILTTVRSDELESGDIEYGLVSDLVVARKHRRLGVGQELLEAAEAYARTCDVKWLRIGLLAGNQVAENLYRSMGFSNLYVELEKDLTISR